MTKCSKRKKNSEEEERRRRTKNDRTTMDESEKIFFLKFVVRLWDDDDDDDKRRAPKPPPTICRTATPLRILLGCTRPRRKECPVDDDDRTTTRTTARCEYKFSVARLFFFDEAQLPFALGFERDGAQIYNENGQPRVRSPSKTNRRDG